MLEVVIPLFLCAAPAGRRTISNGTPGFGAPSECIPLFHMPPGCTLLGYLRASIFHILPYLGREHSVGVRRAVGACLYVCGRKNTRRQSKLPAAAMSRRESKRSSCTAKEHFNLQYNGMQRELIDHRCFITYPFTIIGRDVCPFASIQTIKVRVEAQQWILRDGGMARGNR